MKDLIFRAAAEADLPAIIAMLADDALGATREDPRLPLHPAYLAGFAAITADPHQFLVVAERAGAVVGVFQLSLLPGLSHKGLWRGQIESVRVAANCRGEGIGEQMIRHAIALARSKGCGAVQLTTNKSRQDAKRFYARLGFEASHEGMKLKL
jgi:ribosomal protein S18 acetylase RimI-like enzyme